MMLILYFFANSFILFKPIFSEELNSFLNEQFLERKASGNTIKSAFDFDAFLINSSTKGIFSSGMNFLVLKNHFTKPT